MDRERSKKHAALAAVQLVRDGMTVGLGTGSTAALVLEELAARIRGGLRVRGVPTSEATAAQARSLGIPLATFDEVESLDLAIDGADEIDAAGSAIKGGGGALLREKVVAAATAGPRVAVVDESKVVARLGAFPLPLEVVPFATSAVARWITSLGATVTLRQANGAPVLSDNGFQLLDCRFGPRDDWHLLAPRLAAMPGVAEHGLFLDCFDWIVIGSADGAEVRRAVRPEGRRLRPV
jgi:ribose 5-phosphate isomerase A